MSLSFAVCFGRLEGDAASSGREHAARLLTELAR